MCTGRQEFTSQCLAALRGTGNDSFTELFQKTFQRLNLCYGGSGLDPDATGRKLKIPDNDFCGTM